MFFLLTGAYLNPETGILTKWWKIIKPLQGLGVLHEAKLLMLDISKAKFYLGWELKMNISETVALTIDWYKLYITEDVIFGV